MEKIKIEQHGFWTAVWLGAWMFTIGYLKLAFWPAVFALIIWPYYLGASL